MTPPIRFGIITLPNKAWSTLVDHWQYIESLGFDSLWISDHFVNPFLPEEPMFEAWTALAGLATHTSRIRVGTLVTLMAFRNPAFLAKQALTVDHLSGGRLELGLGAGGQWIDHQMAGIDVWSPAEQAERFREVVEIVDHLLRSEVTTYQGTYYRVQEAQMHPAPIQRPRPPLMLAAHGKKGLQLVAVRADAWNTFGIYHLVGDALDGTRLRNQQLDDYCAAAGRDPRTVRRSFLAGLTGDQPFASIQAFQDFIDRYREAGIDEFIFYYPPFAAANGIFERVATEAIPTLKAQSTPVDSAVGPAPAHR